MNTNIIIIILVCLILLVDIYYLKVEPYIKKKKEKNQLINSIKEGLYNGLNQVFKQLNFMEEEENGRQK